MTRFNDDLTLEIVQSKFRYDPEVGELFSTNPKRAGVPEGHINPFGYKRVRFGTKWYQVHRLAWLLSYSTWPIGPIDHINGNRSDNRLVNLRNVTREENAKNRSKDRPKYLSRWTRKIKDEKVVDTISVHGRIIPERESTMNKNVSLKYDNLKTAEDLLQLLLDVRDTENIPLNTILLNDTGPVEVAKTGASLDKVSGYQLNFGVYD